MYSLISGGLSRRCHVCSHSTVQALISSAHVEHGTIQCDVGGGAAVCGERPLRVEWRMDENSTESDPKSGGERPKQSCVRSLQNTQGN